MTIYSHGVWKKVWILIRGFSQNLADLDQLIQLCFQMKDISRFIRVRLALTSSLLSKQTNCGTKCII